MFWSQNNVQKIDATQNMFSLFSNDPLLEFKKTF